MLNVDDLPTFLRAVGTATVAPHGNEPPNGNAADVRHPVAGKGYLVSVVTVKPADATASMPVIITT